MCAVCALGVARPHHDGQRCRPLDRRRATAERFVRRSKECLSRVIPLGSDTRCVIAEFVAHYHLERNHQGLDKRIAGLFLRDAPTETARA